MSAPSPRLKDAAAAASMCERSGDWGAAEQAHARVYALALEEGRVSEAVDALRRQANARWRDRRAEEAWELALLSQTIAERCGLVRAEGRALNLLGIVAYSEARLDEARATLEAALQRARECNDRETIGLACMNLGVVCSVRGDLREARTLYLECIGSAVLTGNREGSVSAYNNLGMICTDLGEWLEAEVFFDRGIEIAERLGNQPILARLYLNRAEPLIRTGEFDRARRSLDRAEALAGSMDDRPVATDARRYRGAIARLEGDYAAAERHLAEALRVASERALPLQEAEVLEETAHLRWSQGRRGAALVLLREARRLFETLRATPDVQRLDETAAEWRAAPAPELASGVA